MLYLFYELNYLFSSLVLVHVSITLDMVLTCQLRTQIRVWIMTCLFLHEYMSVFGQCFLNLYLISVLKNQSKCQEVFWSVYCVLLASVFHMFVNNVSIYYYYSYLFICFAINRNTHNKIQHHRDLLIAAGDVTLPLRLQQSTLYHQRIN